MRKVALINSLEPGLRALPDQALAAKTGEFRGRLARGEPLDAVLPEAFAAVREAATRVLGMRHYDVQLVGCLSSGMPCVYGRRMGGLWCSYGPSTYPAMDQYRQL